MIMRRPDERVRMQQLLDLVLRDRSMVDEEVPASALDRTDRHRDASHSMIMLNSLRFLSSTSHRPTNMSSTPGG
jgi:hypothetical protein